MAPKLSTLTHDDFAAHWRRSHADAAGQIPGARRYVQNHAVMAPGRLLPYPGFDACSEIDFDSVDAMDEGFASETYRQIVQSDEAEFVDKTVFSLVVGRREVLSKGLEHEGIKLLTFWKARPFANVADLTSEARHRYHERLRSAGALRHELVVPIPEAHAESRTPAAADLVDIAWFEALEEARDAALGDAAMEMTSTFGAARLIATPVVVLDERATA